MIKIQRFIVIGRRLLVISGNAMPGGYEVLDVFDDIKQAMFYRNRLDGQEGKRGRTGAIADVCDVRILETMERV